MIYMSNSKETCKNKLINKNGMTCECGDMQSNGERILCYKCQQIKKDNLRSKDCLDTRNTLGEDIMSNKPRDVDNQSADIKLARQCMDFKLIKCDNKECLNTSCPLNKVYGEKE